jgi:hypothetical protein
MSSPCSRMTNAMSVSLYAPSSLVPSFYLQSLLFLTCLCLVFSSSQPFSVCFSNLSLLLCLLFPLCQSHPPVHCSTPLVHSLSPHVPLTSPRVPLSSPSCPTVLTLVSHFLPPSIPLPSPSCPTVFSLVSYCPLPRVPLSSPSCPPVFLLTLTLFRLVIHFFPPCFPLSSLSFPLSSPSCPISFPSCPTLFPLMFHFLTNETCPIYPSCLTISPRVPLSSPSCLPLFSLVSHSPPSLLIQSLPYPSPPMYPPPLSTSHSPPSPTPVRPSSLSVSVSICLSSFPFQSLSRSFLSFPLSLWSIRVNFKIYSARILPWNG